MNENIKKTDFRKMVSEAYEKVNDNGVIFFMGDGELLDRVPYGKANANDGEPMKEDCRYLFTLQDMVMLRLLLFMLMDEKKVRLTDKLDKYFPEYAHANKITVKNLVMDSTGMEDFFYGPISRKIDEECEGQPEEVSYSKTVENACKYYTFDDVMGYIGEHDLEKKPGDDESWKNVTNTVFLRELVERISGKSVFELAKEKIFVPCEMSTVKQLNKDFSMDILFRNKNYISVNIPVNPCTFTATVYDFEKLATALLGGKLLSEKTRAVVEKIHNSESSEKESCSLLYMDLDGFNCFSLDFYGQFNCASLFCDRSSGFIYGVLTRDVSPYIIVDGDYCNFRITMRSKISAAITYPVHTTMEKYSPDNWFEAYKIEVEPEQLEFVDSAKITIASAASCPKTNHLYVEMENGRAVGLLNLIIDKKHNKYEIDIVQIDKRYQHRGFGKVMLRFAVDTLKAAGAKHLSIGVNRSNIAAQNLYKSVGFKPDKIYESGIIMTQDLE